MKYVFISIIGFFFWVGVYGQQQKSSLIISCLTNDFYLYTTYKTIDGKPFPSNSMYVITDSGVIMIDTPWDVDQTNPLLDSIENKHHKKVVMCIVTHSHADRTAGLDILKQKGIKTFSTQKTLELSKKQSEKQAAYYFISDTTFDFGNHSFQTYYPGEGHTKDNIIIWFSKEKILYGGCLVKSTEANGLGNVADANLAQWPISIKHVMEHFPKPIFVIPGHNGWSINQSLKHTLKLLYQKGKASYN